MEDIETRILTLFERGFIPAPEETPDTFFKRFERVALDEKNDVPISPQLTKMYGVKKLYGKVFYSNKGIYFWEAAVSWIDRDFSTEIQLRESFKEGASFLGYSKQEVLDHEAVHAIRAPLESAFFEEVFAYKTSPQWLRRFLGPALALKSLFILAFFLIPALALFFLDVKVVTALYISLLCFFCGVFCLHFPPFILKKKLEKAGAPGEKIVFLLSDKQIFYFFLRPAKVFFTWLEETPPSAQKILCKTVLHLSKKD